MKGDIDIFLSKIFQNLKETGISRDDLIELDHIAYRTETKEQYEKLKNEFSRISQNFNEVDFGGRPIAVFKLISPIEYGGWQVFGIELLAPKKDHTFKEGMEHAEFVTKIPLEEFRKKHGDLDFNLKAFNREINPELILEFGDCAIKFHETSLLKIRNLN